MGIQSIADADAPAIAKAAAPPARRRAARTPPRGGRKPARKRAVRWSARRERLFLERLGECSNVAASARAAGLSTTTVYRRRTADAEFRARWMVALREGFVRLEADLLDRALNGVRKDVWHGGKKVGEVTEYSERLALALLAAHRHTVMGGGDVPLPSPDAMRERLAARLDQVAANLAGEDQRSAEG